MRGAQAGKPGVSSRRFACDRCRGQKLRCLRENADQESRCDRCSRAGVECTTSPIFRMREYVAGDDSESRKRLRRDSDAPQQPQSNSSSADEDKLNTLTSFSIQTPMPAAIFTGPDSSNDAGQLGFNGWSLPIKPMDEPASEPLPLLPTQEKWDVENMLLDVYSFPENPEDATFVAFDVSTNENYSPIDFQQSTTYTHSRMDSLMPSPHSASPTHGSEQSQKEDMGFLPAGYLEILNLEAPTDQVDEETHMRRLSEINVDLVGQFCQIHKDFQNPILCMLIPPLERVGHSVVTPGNSVLKTTRQFLDVLVSLSNSIKPASSSQAAGGPDSTQLSAATLLLIITCYVHILRLYIVVFARIETYFQEVSESENPYLDPIPGLGLNDFPLQSGNLQATVFIQIATSLFERMECILGLPRDARINKREVDCDGLLGDENFSKIAKLVFSKMEFDQSENVEGGIKSLRKSLKKVRQLLRERIAP